jgi:hypothetical protein
MADKVTNSKVGGLESGKQLGVMYPRFLSAAQRCSRDYEDFIVLSDLVLALTI